jgi:aminoglycoside phosphotransferase (APT) family kinase protein
MLPEPHIAHAFFGQVEALHVQPCGSGNIHDTYLLTFRTPAGQERQGILQRLNHRVFARPDAVMRNIQAIAKHLQNTDYPPGALIPIPNAQGDTLYRDAQQHYWRAFPYFAHTYAPEHLPTPEEACEAARAYGLFLKALTSCPAETVEETIPHFHDPRHRWVAFEAAVAKDLVGRSGCVQAEVARLYEQRTVFEAIARLKETGQLPVRIVHNDTKAGNVLLSHHNGKAVAVIDWDTLMPGTVLSDFGDMVRTFAPDHYEDEPGEVAVRPLALQALEEGFLEGIGSALTPAERQHLHLGARWIVAEQALRFLTDYLNGDTYYKIRYPEHNLVRARNQLSLLAHLPL